MFYINVYALKVFDLNILVRCLIASIWLKRAFLKSWRCSVSFYILLSMQGIYWPERGGWDYCFYYRSLCVFVIAQDEKIMTKTSNRHSP
jgi:hypothetical protein